MTSNFFPIRLVLAMEVNFAPLVRADNAVPGLLVGIAGGAFLSDGCSGTLTGDRRGEDSSSIDVILWLRDSALAVGLFTGDFMLGWKDDKVTLGTEGVTVWEVFKSTVVLKEGTTACPMTGTVACWRTILIRISASCMALRNTSCDLEINHQITMLVTQMFHLITIFVILNKSFNYNL